MNIERHRTFNPHIKVRYKNVFYLVVLNVLSFCVWPVHCNRPPRFLINGQTEIVLRLKEGNETPVGKSILI